MTRSVCPARHELLQCLIRTVAFGAAWLACVGLSACNKAPEVPPPPRPVARGPVKSRADVIRRAADEIAAECQRAAGGDWERWQRDTACYRTALKARAEASKSLKDLPPPPGEEKRAMESSYEVLEGKNDFPLFEVAPQNYLAYLYDPDVWARYRKEQPVVAADRWLRERGIDLIFVPVPKMTEVYIEKFLDRCPPDGIIAPNVRRDLLDLLNEGVEVVDAFDLFRSARDNDPELLYNVADSHWAPRAMRIMASELADRIQRYDFGAKARDTPPITATLLCKFDWEQNGWWALNSHQQKLAKAANLVVYPHAVLPNGQPLPDDANSPVMVIGHSYVNYFREQVMRELNLITNTLTGPGFTTQFFADFVREPETLDHCKVVVWITTEGHMTCFEPLPPVVLAALKDK